MTEAEGMIEAIEDLTRRVSEDNVVAVEAAVEDGLLIRQCRQDEQVVTLDLEKYRGTPRRARGHAHLHDVASFVAYVKRIGAPALTSVWADLDGQVITAVFNDHEDYSLPGWRDHYAQLAVQPDPDWTTWSSKNQQAFHQESFAEFIEDHYDAIIDPSAAEMLEVALSFKARKTAKFERATNLQSGDVQLVWHEETTASAGAKGQLEVPKEFTIRVAPFRGSPTVDVLARLRYRIGRDGALSIFYRLHRPADLKRVAFDQIVAGIQASLADFTVLTGHAPIHA